MLTFSGLSIGSSWRHGSQSTQMTMTGGFNGRLRTSHLHSIRLARWALSLPEWDTHFGFNAVIPSGKDDCFEPPECCCTTQPTL